MVDNQGLSRVREIYQDRSLRAKDLKKEGRQVIGYLCLYPVVELLTAFDMIPYRMFGDIKEPITEADSCLPTVVCPFLRSMLDLGLKGKYDFLDGVVMSHVCEVGEKTAHIWRTYIKNHYAYFIDTPHVTHKAAQQQHKEQLEEFKKSLEAYTGKTLTTAKLYQAVKAHNEQRTLVRELYDLRKPNPPLISGAEILQTLVSLMSLPVDEGNRLIQQVIAEVKARQNKIEKKPRLLLWGSILDDITLVDMIENAGANVVMDDICVGSRAYFADVRLEGDLLQNLAYRYLVEVKCPRTFRGSNVGEIKRDYMTDLENRFGYIKSYIKNWNATGVILQSVRYCDIHGYEVPLIKDYLESLKIPTIYIEHDYSRTALAPLKTRVQAFIEMLG